MAGSHDMVLAPVTAADPILAARVEALKLLGDRISERVMVLDRGLTIRYANHPGWAAPGKSTGGSGCCARPSTCYEACLKRSDPCGDCPVIQVFESGVRHSVSYGPDGNRSACKVLQVTPLMDGAGEAASVLVVQDVQADEAGCEGAEPSRLGELIAQGPGMRRLFEMIRLVADSQASVLLQGESGTGKELVARTIHRLSGRRDRPFVVVDCGALPATLLESELFGHVKGAFTGAVSSKKGLFEEAEGGTVFLDEIADTSGHFQSKLLRVLQEREIKPVGSSRSVKVNARVISATNKNLMDLIRIRAFREDLYYRLAVLPLSLPPLRERREDIPLLVRAFVERASRRNQKPLRPVSSEAMCALTEASWPGNVRELQHTVERAVVTAPGPKLTLSDFFGVEAPPRDPADLRSVARQAVATAERMRILEALQTAGGKRTRAARLLRISRANLYNKLKAYNVE
jgi:two-component system response regulator HydG